MRCCMGFEGGCVVRVVDPLLRGDPTDRLTAMRSRGGVGKGGR